VGLAARGVLVAGLAILLALPGLPPAAGLATPVTQVVAFTVYNTHPEATGTYEQMMKVDSAEFSANLNPTLSNEEWSYVNGTTIPSWIESNATPTATATYTWLKLFSIPEESELTVELNIFPKGTNLFAISGPSGEAPQLASPWGDADDGAVVFPDYWNFSGTSFPEGWDNCTFNTNNQCVASTDPGADVHVSNGVSVYGGSSGTTGDTFWWTGWVLQGQSIDASFKAFPQTYTDPAGGRIWAGYWQSTVAAAGNTMQVCSYSYVCVDPLPGSNTTYYIGNISEDASALVSCASLNYTASICTPGINTVTDPRIWAPSGDTIDVQWYRVRQLAASGVMPSEQQVGNNAGPIASAPNLWWGEDVMLGVFGAAVGVTAGLLVHSWDRWKTHRESNR
jgi:hypothetical protein